MESIVDFVSILAAPVFGLLGVWLGGFLQARKDDARWARERASENEARWLHEKHQLYTEVMFTVERLRVASRRAFYPHPSYMGQPEEVRRGYLEEVKSLTAPAQNAVESIGVLGTAEVYEPAIAALLSIASMSFEAQTFDETEGFGPIIQAYSNATEAVNRLRAAIRAELRIGGPSPEAS